ncbi:MAG TPA: nuclear transport factor 2 family protein [Acidimicrobiia bacterium]|nr:nuclear transport factor 2 family protein [Acidimicrobiia bacterium]
MTLEDWIEAYRLAWVNRDAEAAAALFSEDASYRSNIFEEPHRGRSGVKEYWESVTSTQSEVTVTMGVPFVDGSRVAVEFWTVMRVEGEEVTLPGCLLLDFDEHGLCRRLREYWHFIAGRHHPPEGWGR